MRSTKYVAFLLLFLFVASFTVGAHGEQFSLRNGYRWGMSMQSIEKLADDENLIRDADSDSDAYHLSYEKVPVGDLYAKMVLSFNKDDLKLVEVLYYFTEYDKSEAVKHADELEYIMGSLQSAYGSDSGTIPGRFTQWLLPDTTIALLHGAYNVDEKLQVTIVYSASANQVKNNGF